ncbi:MAG: hypothetical protein WBS24_15810 [Terriglobales bacterium]
MRIIGRIVLLGTLGILAMASQGAAAQGDKKPASPESAAQNGNAAANKPLNVYRLDFVLSEFLDGKKVNTRSYTVTAREDEMNKLRSGARYPIATATADKNTTQFQYLDIGVSIDCRVVERGGYLELNAVVESSDIEGADTHGVPNSTIDQSPVVGQMKSDIRSLIRPGTPTMVSSMEDPASKRRYQLDVTATKVN